MKRLIRRILKLTRTYNAAVVVLCYVRRHSGRYPSRFEGALWYENAIKLYSRFIAPGSLCFDIGANVGSRTNVFRKLGATVVTVEPQQSCVKSLKRRFGRDPNVIICEKAVGAEEGTSEMFVNNWDNAWSSLSREWIDRTADADSLRRLAYRTTISVPVTTLDSLIRKYGVPAFCKIDVEGYEYEVIKGLNTSIKALSVEVHPCYLDVVVSCIQRLRNLGMKYFNYSARESMILALNNWVSGTEMCDILHNLSDKHEYYDVYASVSSANPVNQQ